MPDPCNATLDNLPCMDAMGRTLSGDAYSLTIVEPLRVAPPEGYRLDSCYASSYIRHTWVDPTIGDEWDLITTVHCGSYETFAPKVVPEPTAALLFGAALVVAIWIGRRGLARP
jgi:hypothetical protein